MIPRTFLEVTATSTGGSIVRVTYSAKYDGSWHNVVSDTNSADGWVNLWETYNLSEQTIDVRAEIEDSLGNTQTITRQGIALSRSYLIGGIYHSRVGNNGNQEGEPSTGMEQSVPQEADSVTPEPQVKTVITRRAAFNTRWKFLLY